MATDREYLNAQSLARNNYVEAGSNGLEGFKTWECYMLVKYGKPRFIWY